MAVVKPAQTGLAPGEPGDVDEVRRLVGDEVVTHELVRLRDPLSPEAAARREGVRIPPVAQHAKRIGEIAAESEVVFVEGAGGLLVRLDERGGTLADLGTGLRYKGVGCGVVLVASAGLGTLNTAALTAEALAARSLPLLGVVIGSWPADPGLAEESNLVDLPRVTGAPLWGRIPQGAGALTREPTSSRGSRVVRARPELPPTSMRRGSGRQDGPHERAPEVEPDRQPYRVTVVCWGNICRSPMGEFLLREAFEDAGLGDRVVVDSAGTSSDELGNGMHRAHRRGAAPQRPRGQRLGRPRRAPLRAELVRRVRPRAARRPRARASGWSTSPAPTPTAPSCACSAPSTREAVAAGELGMDDPWYGTDPAYDQTYAEITAAVPGIVEHVRTELAGAATGR